MPIPNFSAQGVLPPYIGANPAGASNQLSPFSVTATEVVSALGKTDQRLNILQSWLTHRSELRGIGIVSGFQWLDGSFVEDKVPNDLDIASFVVRPVGYSDDAAWAGFIRSNLAVLSRAHVKARHPLDFFVADFGSTPETLVGFAAYFLNLFSHRRVDNLWKGMLRVSLDDPNDDALASQTIANSRAAIAAGITP